MWNMKHNVRCLYVDKTYDLIYVYIIIYIANTYYIDVASRHKILHNTCDIILFHI